MRVLQVEVTIANLADPGRAFKEMFWVDTGAMYSYVPKDRLQQIEVAPRTTREFVLADGRRERRAARHSSRFTILAKRRLARWCSAPPDSLFLLGPTALENFCVNSDPNSQTLKPVTAVIGSMLASRLS
jgi:hypothetical protein